MIVPVQVRWPRLRRADQGLPLRMGQRLRRGYGRRERLLLEAVVAGGELGVVQFGVETARGEQLLVAALLHDVAVAHNQDEIGRADGGEPMRDDEGRASRHEPVHGLLDAQLGARVHRRGGLVQNEHAAVGQKGPGDGDELALALAQVARVLVDLEVVAAGQHADEMVGIGKLRRRDAFVIRRVRIAVADVLHDGAGEQVGVLQHRAQRVAQGVLLDVLDVDAVIGDGAGIGVGGEGYTTFTIAGPTGEGLTSAKSFARRRRCVLVGGMDVR